MRAEASRFRHSFAQSHSTHFVAVCKQADLEEEKRQLRGEVFVMTLEKFKIADVLEVSGAFAAVLFVVCSYPR